MYRERADYCYEMAAKAPTEDIKAGWVRTAEIWLLLDGEKAGRTSTDARDAASSVPDSIAALRAPKEPE